jgi:hypothetical protein
VNVKRAEGAARFGVEFTSISSDASRNIRRLVHLLIQGTGSD